MNGPTKPGDFGDPVADSIRREQQQDAAPHPDDVREPAAEEQFKWRIQNLQYTIQDLQQTIRDIKRNLVLADSEDERQTLIELLEQNIVDREEAIQKLEEVKEDAQDAE